MGVLENAPYLVAQGAGILLLVSIVWLLFKRVIYVDATTKQPIEFELPILGKLKSQNPVIALVLIAAGLTLYPLRLSDQARSARLAKYAESATIEGEVETTKPVTVTIVPLPRFQETLQASGPFTMAVPIIPDVAYRAWFSVDGKIANDQSFKLGNNAAKLAKFTYAGETAPPPLVTKKEVPDADLKEHGIL
jgi:hypothetical protein